MGSLSTLNLIKYSLVPQRTTLSSSSNPNLPSKCFTSSNNYFFRQFDFTLQNCFTNNQIKLPLFTSSSVLTGACMNRNNNLSLNYQFNGRTKISTVTCIQVATADAPKQEYYSTAQGHDTVNEVEDRIEYIRRLLKTIDDGKISVSAYDTAWIALIKDLEGRDSPQFPSSVEWIAENQLPDGSWGDDRFFCIYDRLINTIACVVALRSWNLHAHKIEKGIRFIKENVHKLEDANEEHMTCGFEVVFPALLHKAQDLGISGIPYNAPEIEEIYKSREKKLKRIPMEVMHKVPTSLLFSLEGLENLEWEKLLKLQSPDGSFLTSPSSTAFAFIHTKDRKCFDFINNIVHTFKGGAPHTYPVDIFGRLWAVDRLQRLGISRFFESEIGDCLSHVHRFWSDKGVFSGRNSVFCDIDDTSMGVRLLRMHGYDINPNVLENFKQGDKFTCYGGQMIECSSPIYNLYRASQLRFPGEKIMEEANKFAYKFLQEKLASNQILDKWVISNHLSDEIRVGLEMAWYATLPRVEARYYLQHYGGGDDVWIGKTLYRMPEISNDTYLELAKIDFRRCQAQHQFEWNIYMQEWYDSCNLGEFGISRKDVLVAYFLAGATIFEVERAKERLAWAKSQIIMMMIKSFFNNQTTTSNQKQQLLTEFGIDNALHKSKIENREDGVVNMVVATLNQFVEGFDDLYTRHQLKSAWRVWLRKAQQDGGAEAELLTTTLNTCANQHIVSHYHDYNTLSKLTNTICHKLSQIQHQKVQEMKGGFEEKCSIKNIMEVEDEMQCLVKLVLEKSATNGMHRKHKQTFLSIAKTYYYRAYYADEIMDAHIFKVLFEPVV